MTPVLSQNTQAILLLTAPLIAGRGNSSSDLLTPGEYKRLARHLREIQCEPADLVSRNAAETLRACQSVIEESRLQSLLGRGFLLSQVIERWQARAIWVVSRADANYPRRLKARLREDAPAVIYGCGDMGLLDSGGLAVVGSRHVDDSLVEYTMAVGRLVAHAGSTIISGGAKGIDQAAMRGALEAGGKVCGVLADSLEKTVMNREHRNLLMDGQLVLISPYDPSAGFNVGNAMQRNKLIYALADASLVVSSDFNKGGTWAGAIEQLDKLKFVPVFVRATGDLSAGLDGLRRKGALPWPNPEDADSFADVFNVNVPSVSGSQQVGMSLFDGAPTDDVQAEPSVVRDVSPLKEVDRNPKETGDVGRGSRALVTEPEDKPQFVSDTAAPVGKVTQSQLGLPPAEALFAAVRLAMSDLLKVPMKDSEVAVALNVSGAQAKAWLQRLVDEGVVEKQKKPAGYVMKQRRLFE